MAIVTPTFPSSRTVTALDLIKRAYRLIGVYSIGETPSAEESNDGLNALNAMLDSWANEKLMIYAATQDIFPLTAGDGTYTIGDGADIDSLRPQKIDPSTYINYQGVSFELTVCNLKQYNEIRVKTITGSIPTILYYDPTYPEGTINLWPLPTAGCTLHLWSWKPLGIFLNVTDEVSLPPGYEDAIVFNLAANLAPENEVPVPAQVEKRATLTKKVLKRNNSTPIIVQLPNEVLPGFGQRTSYWYAL